MNYPNDSDGDALNRIAKAGSDMSKPMDIDFAVAVPNEESGKAVANLAVEKGYKPEIIFDDESMDWTCYCTKRMVPSYESIIFCQNELDNISAKFNAYSDGWGTLGNI